MRIGRTIPLPLLLLCACGPARDRSDPGADDPGMGGTPMTPRPPGTGGPGGPGGNPDQAGTCGKMDLVFVIDNSGSMAEEQANLAANFPRFIEVLNKFQTKDGKALDYRVAITTTGRDLNYKIVVPIVNVTLPMNEKGENGAFQQKNNCGMTKRWIDRDEPGGADKVFACAAKVGTGGPSIEMPLYAGLSLSLQDRVADGTNKGFLREDALLATVILSDEDDCSREDNNFTVPNDQCTNVKEVQPVDKYISMLDKVKGDRGRWATAVIAGPTSCKSAFGEAAAANRLKDFVQQTGKNAVFSSICDGDLTKALEDALQTFSAACETFPPLG